MLDNDTVVSRLPEIDGTAIKVYLALARRADSSGRCWPSVATIGRDTGICGRSVQYALRRLTDLGLLTIDQQTGKAAVYCLTRASSCTPTNTGDAPGCTTPLHRDAPGGASTCTTPLHRDAPKQETGTTPKNNTQGTTPKARGCAASVSVPVELDSEIFREAWGRWTAHRKELRKPLTPTTTAAQLKRLSAWGVIRAVAAIDRSIEAGWTGIFEERSWKSNRFPSGKKAEAPEAPYEKLYERL